MFYKFFLLVSFHGLAVLGSLKSYLKNFIASFYLINFVGPQSVMPMNTIHSLYNVFKNLSVTV